MLAIGFIIALVAFWWLLGYAVLSLTTDRPTLAEAMLAPTVGMFFHILTLFITVRLGSPIGPVVWPLAIVLPVLAGLVLIVRRPGMPNGTFTLGALLAGAMFLSGWPVALYPFDWLGFCNDDMANYCLAGVAFQREVLNSPALAPRVLDASDYSLSYWFLYTGSARIGSEILLAWSSTLSGYTTLNLFMPTVVAMHVLLVSAVGFLCHRVSGSNRTALIGVAVAACSPLMSLGVCLCLIAQTGGLAGLVATLGVLCSDYTTMSRGQGARHGLLAGLCIAGLAVLYTEVIPFAVLPFVAFVLFRMRSLWKSPGFRVAAVTATVSGLAILNFYLPLCVKYILAQTAGNQDPATMQALGSDYSSMIIDRWPLYFVPEGFTFFWGILPSFSRFPPGPILTLLILFGMGVTVIALYGWLRGFRQADAAWCALSLMIGIGAMLMLSNNAFGVYKIAMYIQPLLVAFFVPTVLASRRRFTVALLLVVVAMNLRSQYHYVADSQGIPGSHTEVPLTSSDHLLTRLQAEIPRDGRPLLIDTPNGSLAKFALAHTRGTPTSIPSTMFLMPLGISKSIANEDAFRAFQLYLSDGPLAKVLDRQPETAAHFKLHDPNEPALENRFHDSRLPVPDAPGRMLLTGRPTTVFNRHRMPHDESLFRIAEQSDVSNHLLFIPSLLGQPYMNTSKRIAFFQTEPEPLQPDRRFAGVGRYALFNVHRPSQQFRLKLDLTGSYAALHQYRVPSPFAIGATRVPLQTVGCGSALVYSEPFSPQYIDGKAYVMVDLNRDGLRFDNYYASRLQKLFGTDIHRDRRWLCAFTRDISLVSEEEYAAIAPPPAFKKFPADLNLPGAEYSGIYEDGWIADGVMARFTRPADATTLTLTGEVTRNADPEFRTTATVLIDGKEPLTRELPIGPFTLEIPAAGPQGPVRCEIRFSKVQPIGPFDPRPAAIRVTSFGF